MRKLSLACLTAIILLGLTQCHTKPAGNISGRWHLQQLVINGTDLHGAAIKNWVWQFDAAGTYNTDMSGSADKGTYLLKDGLLTLRSNSAPLKADEIYQVAKLDSFELNLVSVDVHNKESLKLSRR